MERTTTPPAPETLSRVALPPEAAEVMRPLLPALSEEIVEAIGRQVEPYQRPLEGPFGRAVRTGTERALNRFLDLITEPGSEDREGGRIYVQLGRGEFREGRSLDALLAAYRLGARLAWRRFAAAGDAAGLPPEAMYRLGEAIFAYIDELSAESAEGYAQAQSAAEGERSRRRRELVALLGRQPPAEEAAVRELAAQVGWELPERLAALVTAEHDEVRLATRLGSGVIAASFEDRTVALIPDPDAPGRRAQLDAAVERRAAALGPAVTWRRARSSLERAELAHRLQRDGRLPPEGLVSADEHLPELMVHGDRDLAEHLAETELAPLRALADGPRRKLEATLRAWLDYRGRPEEVAHHLGVHPQTVRYRLNQLRELFGRRLEDPEQRLALSLALRAASQSPH
ncbi:MAG: PucR family transcriptional regulator [Thermoleophilaceae bacterium]